MQVINHAVSKPVMSSALDAAANFFALEKKEYASEDGHQPVRYGVCPEDERIIKPRDFLKQYAHPLDEGTKSWPRFPPDYRYERSFQLLRQLRELPPRHSN